MSTHERRNGRPQIAAETEHIPPDPVAAAYDSLSAAKTAGKDDPAARAILQAVLSANGDHAAPTRTGADIAEGLRSKEGGYQEQARSEIRKLIDPGPSLTDVLTDHEPEPPAGLLARRGLDARRHPLSVLTGAGGAGKSRIALQLAVAVATGADHFIWPANGPVRLGGPEAPELLATGPVVFAAWETRKLAWQNRLAAVCGHLARRDRQAVQPTALHQHAARGRFVGMPNAAHTQARPATGSPAAPPCSTMPPRPGPAYWSSTLLPPPSSRTKMTAPSCAPSSPPLTSGPKITTAPS